MQIATHTLSLISKQVSIQKSTTWATILDEVAFQAEYAVRDYYFATQRPSTVAIAAIFNAIEIVDTHDIREILAAFVLVMNDSFDSQEHLLAARDRLLCLVQKDKTS